MKKTIFALLLAAAVAAVAVVACKKETDGDKGKADAKKACECYKKASTPEEEEKCEEIANQNGSEEYIAAFIATVLTTCPEAMGAE